jgi:flagellar basal-body rod protein FlgG
MNRGLYVAASGMVAEQARQDQLSNDLANTATPGYKPDRVSQKAFGELLVRNVADTSYVGSMAAGVRLEKQTTDTTPAPLRETDEPLDLAIDGEGYFGVQTSAGVKYTRNGSFTSTPDGTVVDQTGQKVLGKDGKPMKVKADGSIDPTTVGVFDLKTVTKTGDQLGFTGRSTGQATGVVRTGFLEGSGVDAARTMVELMSSLRAFEAGQRAITTIDSTLDKANQVSSIR